MEDRFKQEVIKVVVVHAELTNTIRDFQQSPSIFIYGHEHLASHAVVTGYNLGNEELMQKHCLALLNINTEYQPSETLHIHEQVAKENESLIKGSRIIRSNINGLLEKDPTSHNWADIEMFHNDNQIDKDFVAEKIIPSNLGLINILINYRLYITNTEEEIKTFGARSNFENILIILDIIKDLDLAKTAILSIPNIKSYLPEIRRITKYEIRYKKYAFEGAIDSLVSRLNDKTRKSFICTLEHEKLLLQRFTDFEDPKNISRRVEAAIVKLDRILSTINL